MDVQIRSAAYNPSATDDDGSCGLVIPGCMTPSAENYMSVANFADNSLCAWRGCTDSGALNYDPTATVYDFTCEPPRPGCTQTVASNFLYSATVDDGSCYILGCTNTAADNYSPQATADDGTCVVSYEGCMDSRADNYNPLVTAGDPGVHCEYVGCPDPPRKQLRSPRRVRQWSLPVSTFPAASISAPSSPPAAITTSTAQPTSASLQRRKP